MEYQQPHSLPTEPVTMMDLQAGVGQNSEHCHPLSAHPLQSWEGYLLYHVLVEVGEGGGGWGGKKKRKKSKRIYRTSKKIRITNVFL